MALRAHLQQQQADAAVAERSVALWQQQLDDTIIRAPFGGIVPPKDAQPGEMISPVSAGGGFTRTGICTVVDMSSLEIEIDVNESYINRVEPGQPVEATLDAYPDWKIPCNVIAIIPTADRQKSTVKVRVGFDKLDPRILPEMAREGRLSRDGRAAAAASGRWTCRRRAVHQRGRPRRGVCGAERPRSSAAPSRVGQPGRARMQRERRPGRRRTGGRRGPADL